MPELAIKREAEDLESKNSQDNTKRVPISWL